MKRLFLMSSAPSKVGQTLHQIEGTSGGQVKVIEGLSGRRWRTKAERARIAAESMMPGVTVVDVARKHGTTRWQIYDWRKQMRKGNLHSADGWRDILAPTSPVCEEQHPMVLLGRSPVPGVCATADAWWAKNACSSGRFRRS